jgi:hypothetical protein
VASDAVLAYKLGFKINKQAAKASSAHALINAMIDTLQQAMKRLAVV